VRKAEEARVAVAQAEAARAAAQAQGAAALEKLKVDSALAIEEAAAKRQALSLQAEAEAAAARDAARLAAEEASWQRREAARLAAETELLQRKAALDGEAAVARVAAESRARMEEERGLEDVRLRAVAAAAAAERDKWRGVIASAAEVVSAAAAGVTWQRAATAVGLVLAAYATWQAVRVTSDAARAACAAMVAEKRPALVRYTSRRTGWGSRCCCRGRPKLPNQGVGGKEDDWLAGMVLPAAVERQARDLAATIRYARLHSVPLRHALLHGPPGTGKTMLAQRLATGCGMDYAIISGGDVAPLGEAAVTELNTLMEWASSTPAGMVLFIDEAEAFLQARSSGMAAAGVAAATRLNVMSTLLHHTGQASTKLMLVLATNRPSDLDDAILDRLDVQVHLDVPDAAARVRLCRQLFHRHITKLAGCTAVAETTASSPVPSAATLQAEAASAATPPGALLMLAPDVTVAAVDAIAHATAGCSGRQLDKLFLSLQARAFASAAATTSPGKHVLPVITAAMVQEAAAAFVISLHRASGQRATDSVAPLRIALESASSGMQTGHHAAGVGGDTTVEPTAEAGSYLGGGGGLSLPPIATARKPSRR